MKLIRYGEAGHERPGIILGEEWYDVSEITRDYDESFFASNGLESLRQVISQTGTGLRKLDRSIRLGPPVARPSKIICIGLNYSDHARESNMALPAEPVIFFKATSAITGPFDPLVIPKDSRKTDWEVELAVVIGKKALHVPEEKAADYIAGYLLHNDYSEREFQLERSGQWVKGKSCDSFAPLGPWLATPDEFTDIGNCRLWLTVNGQLMQDGSTKNLVFGIPHLVSYVSRFMTLLPGDIISTGTPAGVGMGQKPVPVYIQPGDVIELGIDGLGISRQVAVAYPGV